MADAKNKGMKAELAKLDERIEKLSKYRRASNAVKKAATTELGRTGLEATGLAVGVGAQVGAFRAGLPDWACNLSTLALGILGYAVGGPMSALRSLGKGLALAGLALGLTTLMDMLINVATGRDRAGNNVRNEGSRAEAEKARREAEAEANAAQGHGGAPQMAQD